MVARETVVIAHGQDPFPILWEKLINAVDGPYNGRVILSGTAGTGKTTLTKRVVQNWRGSVQLLAPTGKAARRISDVVGRPAGTIHSAIYGAPIEDETGKLTWQNPIRIGGEGCLVVIDEASMIGLGLVTDIDAAIDPGTTVLFVGDPEQLPPVNDGPGVSLGEPDVRLTEVHRSSDGIMRFAYMILACQDGPTLSRLIQTCGKPGRFPGVFSVPARGAPGFIPPEVWRAQTIKAGSDSTLITYKNHNRHELNRTTRIALEYGDDLFVGEPLVVMSNNKTLGCFNGEVVRVTKAHMDPGEEDPDRPLHLLQLKVRNVVGGPEISTYTTLAGFTQDPSSWREERRDDITTWRHRMNMFAELRNPRWIAEARRYTDGDNVPNPGPPGQSMHVNWGYCLTCHKMQGSEADNVGIVWGGRDGFGAPWADYPWLTTKTGLLEARAWWYTAVTRARKAVIVWTS